MELNEAKAFVDISLQAGRTRLETVDLIKTLPLNGTGHDVMEYIEMKYAEAAPELETLNFTDSENAEYFTRLYANRLRYDHRRNRWLEWYGHYWRTDNDGQITRLALRAVRARYHGATEIEDGNDRADAAKKAITSEQRARLTAMTSLAQDFKPIADSGEQWDVNPYLFGMANTVINLKTGQPIPGNQDDGITMITPVKFDAQAKATRWESFLNEVFQGDVQLIKWVQRYYGYCMVGLTTEQIIPIAHGGGSNGKTVMLNVLEYVFGDYAYNAPFTMFEMNGRSAIPNDLAALGGKRFVTARETTEGSRFNEGRIKALTGGDPVTARFLHGEFFTFNPVAKFTLAVNSRPRVTDQSFGFWRRVRLIPFNVRFEGSSDDKGLTDTLKAEAAGIINWLIAGCLLWQAEGLKDTPDCITMATREYEADSDPLNDFVDATLALHPGGRVACGEVYKVYKDWAHGQGMTEKETMTLTAFGRKMSQKYKKIKQGGIKYYLDITPVSGQFQDSFIASDINSDVSLNLLYARENKVENCPKLSASLENCPTTTELKCSECGSEDVRFNDDCTQIICPDGHVSMYKGGAE